MEVVNAPRGLKQIPSPSKDKVLLLRKSILPPISELARREDKLAGLRIDADTNMKSREPWYTIEGIKNSQSKGPVQKIQGIPMGSRVHYFSWSKDGENICFTVQTNEGGVLSMLSVWVIHALSLQARPLLPPKMFLNAILFTDLDLTWKNKVLHVVEKWKKKLYTRPLSKSSCGATYEAGFGAIPSSAEVISCKRTDGKVVKANLYLPPVHDRPLPCLIWPYPIESGRKRAISPDSPQVWLRRGYAVITSLSMPEINDVDGDRYNTFIEELVKSIEAIVKEIVDRGVVHPEKISICGHSFGALMTSILLVHVPHLFCCGVAQSGAYNRTLTPFGYQAEYRTLWEATSSYLEMSIILSADKLKKPLLLIHGQEDENAGTWPMQSIRLYGALRGHGAECRLVILPLEGHGYVARESLLHVLWEMDTWFQTHVL